jgi:TPR repeat protein
MRTACAPVLLALGFAVVCLLLPGDGAAQPAAPPDLLEATRWYTGVVGRVDDARAKSLLEKASATGDPLARMWVARCLSRGRMGFPADADRARAMAAGLITDVRRLAVEGVVEAVFLMGTAYDEALGVPEDPAMALTWFRRAAAEGHVLAQHNIGNAYAAGRGLPKDESAAVEWWLKAAGQGDAIPQLRLGEAYEQGKGVERDLAQARRWYADAARRGNAAARAALARLGGPG